MLTSSTQASLFSSTGNKSATTNFFKLSTIQSNNLLEDTDEIQSIYQLPDEPIQSFIQQVLQDIDKPMIQYKFWENSSVIYLSYPTRFTYDANSYMKSKDRRIISEVDHIYNFLGVKYEAFDFVDLVKHMIPPILNQQSELFIKKDGNFIRRNIPVTERYISGELFKAIMKNYADSINEIQLFYSQKINIGHSLDTKRFLESNLLESFCSLMDEYIAYKAVKLQMTKSILEFIRGFKHLSKEVSAFVSMINDYRKIREKIGLFDYLILLRQNILDTEFLGIFIDNALKQSVLTVTRLIQNVAFRHASLKLITDNLNIEYYKDEAYNYITKNIPKIFKTSIDKLFLINQNYLLLKSSDRNMHALILENRIELFTEINKSHYAVQYDKIKTQLKELKNNIFKLITENMVFLLA